MIKQREDVGKQPFWIFFHIQISRATLCNCKNIQVTEGGVRMPVIWVLSKLFALKFLSLSLNCVDQLDVIYHHPDKKQSYYMLVLTLPGAETMPQKHLQFFQLDS